jgi:spermidine synthase
MGISFLVILTIGFAYSEQLLTFAESNKYEDPIVFKKKSQYQNLVLTRGNDLKLFINGNLQFSTLDEYRYHEALVHPGLSENTSIKDVLILGGGDGFAAREVLKYPHVKTITLVDLDPLMTDIFKNNNELNKLNEKALHSDKVKVVNDDAFIWLRDKNKKKFDFVIIDFPDPSNYSLGKLYSTTFYKLLRHTLNPDGKVVIQSTSPYFARKSFWCVGQTLESVGFNILPYHAYVPSFGEWGYHLASLGDIKTPTKFLEGLKFINADTFKQMVNFPVDMSRVKTEINKLNNQILVRYFEDEWSRFY